MTNPALVCVPLFQVTVYGAIPPLTVTLKLDFNPLGSQTRTVVWATATSSGRG